MGSDPRKLHLPVNDHDDGKHEYDDEQRSGWLNYLDDELWEAVVGAEDAITLAAAHFALQRPRDARYCLRRAEKHLSQLIATRGGRMVSPQLPRSQVRRIHSNVRRILGDLMKMRDSIKVEPDAAVFEDRHDSDGDIKPVKRVPGMLKKSKSSRAGRRWSMAESPHGKRSPFEDA